MTRFSMKSKQCFKTLFKVLNKYFGGFVRHSLSLGENKIRNIKHFPSKVLVVCLFVFFFVFSPLSFFLARLEINKDWLIFLALLFKKVITGIIGKRNNIMTQDKFSFSGGKKRKRENKSKSRGIRLVSKKGRQVLHFSKPSLHMSNCTPTVKETTNMFRRAQLSCLIGVCKLKRNNKSQNIKKKTTQSN